MKICRLLFLILRSVLMRLQIWMLWFRIGSYTSPFIGRPIIFFRFWTWFNCFNFFHHDYFNVMAINVEGKEFKGLRKTTMKIIFNSYVSYIVKKNKVNYIVFFIFLYL